MLAWRSEDGNWVWTFVLKEQDGTTTRLVSRNRFRQPTLAARIGMLPMEPGSLVMERKMLRGIKERAERLALAERSLSRHARGPGGCRSPRAAPTGTDHPTSWVRYLLELVTLVQALTPASVLPASH